jgi:hypothetical protein
MVVGGEVGGGETTHEEQKRNKVYYALLTRTKDCTP